MGTCHLYPIEVFTSGILASHPFRKERGKGWGTLGIFPVQKTDWPTFDCRFGALGGSGREIVRALPV
jgi:hypothetical protein